MNNRQHGPDRSDADLLAMVSPHAWVGLVGEAGRQAERRGESAPARCSCGWEGIVRRSFARQLVDHASHQRAMAAWEASHDG